MAEQMMIGTRVLLYDEKGPHTPRVVRTLSGRRVMVEGDEDHVYVFPPQLTVWLSDPSKRESYKAYAAAWRTHRIAAVPELSMPTVEQLLDAAGRNEHHLDPNPRKGFLEVEAGSSLSDLARGLVVRGYIRAKVDQEGVLALARARDVRALPEAEAADLVVGFCEAMAGLLLELARNRLVHNGLLPDRIQVLDRVGSQRLSLRVGPPGDCGGEMYGDARPYLDWFGAALSMALFGHGIDHMPELELDAALDFGVGRRPRVTAGETPRRRLLETGWSDWVPRDARFYGPEELQEAIAALLAEASYCHGGYDLVVRILQICRAWREERHRDLERLRQRVDGLERGLGRLGGELEAERAARVGEMATLKDGLDEAVRSTVERMEQRVHTVRAELVGVDAEQSARLDRLHHELGAETRERTQGQDQLGSQVVELKGSEDVLRERVEGLGQAQEALGQRVTALEGRPAAVERPAQSSWLDPMWQSALVPAGVLLASGITGGLLRWMIPWGG